MKRPGRERSARPKRPSPASTSCGAPGTACSTRAVADRVSRHVLTSCSPFDSALNGRAELGDVGWLIPIENLSACFEQSSGHSSTGVNLDPDDRVALLAAPLDLARHPV